MRLGQRMRGQDLLHEGRLVGDVGLDEAGGQDLASAIELALLGVALGRYLGELGREQALLAGKRAVARLAPRSGPEPARPPGPGHRRARSALRRGSAAWPRSVWVRLVCWELSLVSWAFWLGDQLGEPLLLGERVGQAVGPRGRDRRGRKGASGTAPARREGSGGIGGHESARVPGTRAPNGRNRG